MHRPKPRLLATVLVVAGLVAAAALYIRQLSATTEPVVATARVTRGDVVDTIDATGIVQAVTTVQVGTQISGTVKALHADFNSRVRRGQVIAELEPSLLDAQVAQARATVARLEADTERARVQVDDATSKLRRARELDARQLMAKSDVEAAVMTAASAEAGLRSAAAQVTQARAALNQAEVNLAHATIASPIDGIVISRNVDVGQTVAASMQAPTLFVIARDLTRMEVDARVAESDIGRVRPGLTATFRVDAYPFASFSGTVSQVRLQPIVEQNVVSYVTVIDVANQDLRLKPGMTANATIEVARATAVLRVPNAAMRVRPSDQVLAALHGRPLATGRGTAVWTFTDGALRQVPVHTGLVDASHTAIADGPLAEGDSVVTSIVGGMPTVATATSPLLPAGRGRGGIASGGRRGGG